MESLFKFLSEGSGIAIYILILVSSGVIAVILIYVIALIQGRKISFYPPKIGEKAQKSASLQILRHPDRKKGSDLNDPNSASILLVNRSYMPQLKDVMNLAKKEIILYAVQHTFLRHYGLDTLISKVQNGCKVRILMMSPTDSSGQPNPNVAESESHRTYSGLLEQIKVSRETFVKWYASRTSDEKKNIEIKEYDRCPTVTLTIIDPESDDAQMITELLIYGIDVQKLPSFCLRKHEAKNLFDAQLESFETLWKQAQYVCKSS